jgi:hypothetical protein
VIAAKDYNVMSCHIDSISSCRLRESVEGKREDDSVCLEDILKGKVSMTAFA